ncbi:MAG: UvrB/UvrC motif-containing protein [Acidobacteriaceae bacterium]|nr:UvrB/UvrC motif-containing protein [Acidobacteriaceae bacterium]
MTVPEPLRINPDDAELEQQVAALPQGSGIYLLHLKTGSPHLSSTAFLRGRLRRLLLGGGTGIARNRIRQVIRHVECWSTASRLESSILTYCIARSMYRDDYAARLRLRAPWFLHLTTTDTFPRLAISHSASGKGQPVYGPFASREQAQSYEESILGLFQIRRCAERLEPSPEHPGCIYGEMNYCLRPCQCAVSREEYASETARVVEFLRSNGRSTIASLSTARERASEQMDFETAAQLHKRIERVTAAAAARDEAVGSIPEFNGVALTRSADPAMCRLWPMRQGIWCDPVDIEAASQAQSVSMDTRLRHVLAQAIPDTQPEGDVAENLALFLRWYKSSWRDGEWFPFQALTDLNYRRLVRAISKMMKQGTAVQP